MADPNFNQSMNIQSVFPAMTRSDNDKKASKTIVYVLLIVVILAAVLVTVFSILSRITSPRLKMTSVTVQNLLLTNSSNPSLNATLEAQIAIQNRNHGRFRFDSCKAVILYGNSTIGGGDIASGSVGARKTKVMNVAMRIEAENLNSNGGDYAGTGFVMLQSYAEMRGKVRVLKTAKRKKVRVEMNCSMSLSLNNNSILALKC